MKAFLTFLIGGQVFATIIAYFTKNIWAIISITLADLLIVLSGIGFIIFRLVRESYRDRLEDQSNLIDKYKDMAGMKKIENPAAKGAIGFQDDKDFGTKA